jgi:hypothetical protein
MARDINQGMIDLPEAAPASPSWLLVEAEAVARGFVRRDGSPNVRAFRKFLREIGVTVYKHTRKVQFVSPVEIDATLAQRTASSRMPATVPNLSGWLATPAKGRG